MQTVVEDCLTLDANELARGQAFTNGASGTLEWSNGSSAYLAYRLPHLHLSFELSGTPMWQAIHIEAAPCRFGGSRYYFTCPGCECRRYKLRLGGKGFYCRQCYGLPYYSQECGDLDGLMRQFHKAQAKLDRPMRTTTRMKLIGRLCAIEDKIDKAIIGRFGALEAGKFGIVSD